MTAYPNSNKVYWDTNTTYDKYNGYGNTPYVQPWGDPPVDTEALWREITLLRGEVRTIMEMVHSLQKNLEEMIQDRDFYRIKAEALEAELKKVLDSAE